MNNHYNKNPQCELFIDYNFGVDLESIFEKKYKFKNDIISGCPINQIFSSAPWNIKSLQILKSRLNFHKSKLNDFAIEKWSVHTRKRNPAGEVGWKVRQLIDPEFPTQAWTKFYEIAFTYEIIPKTLNKEELFVSLHLCEAPGAFIASLNHYLKLHHTDLKWEWLATTLNPYYEGNSPSNMISDDRFMFHTLDKWYFGDDETGNLMDWHNSQKLIKKARGIGSVYLVTADGSIDCLEKPDAQEEVVAGLHYCEVITALQALAEGGTFIYKLFTMFEHTTINLLYLVNLLFEEVHIYKPVTSRSGNSEVYCVCKNYKNISIFNTYLESLRLGYGNELFQVKSIFPRESIPDEFIAQIEECADFFNHIQCSVIETNIESYNRHSTRETNFDIRMIKSHIANEFLYRYKLKSILREQEILQGKLHTDIINNLTPRGHKGSYTDRKLYTLLGFEEKLNVLHRNLVLILGENFNTLSEPLWMNLYSKDLSIQFNFIIGKPISTIKSSKFINLHIFKFYCNLISDIYIKTMVDISCATNVENENFDQNIHCRRTTQCLRFQDNINFENNNLWEKQCFDTLLEKIEEMRIGESLLLLNFSLLTRFSVGLLYILAQKYFAKICFTVGNGVFLFDYKESEESYLLNVKNKINQYSEKSLLQIISIHDIYKANFCNNVVLYNNALYKKKCFRILDLIKGNTNRL